MATDLPGSRRGSKGWGAEPPPAVHVLWTPRDLATSYQVSTRTVARWRKMGAPSILLPGDGPRRAVRFDPEAIAAWVAAQQDPPSSQPRRRGRPRRQVPDFSATISPSWPNR